jgi:hypothetical protein
MTSPSKTANQNRSDDLLAGMTETHSPFVNAVATMDGAGVDVDEALMPVG